MKHQDSLYWELRRCNRHLYLDKRPAGAWSAVDRFLLRAMLAAIAGIVALTVIRAIC